MIINSLQKTHQTQMPTFKNRSAYTNYFGFQDFLDAYAEKLSFKIEEYESGMYKAHLVDKQGNPIKVHYELDTTQSLMARINGENTKITLESIRLYSINTMGAKEKFARYFPMKGTLEFADGAREEFDIT